MADTTTMIFRIDPDLKRAFEDAAKQMDRNASQLLRDYIRAFVQQHMARNAQQRLNLAPTSKPANAQDNTTRDKPKKGQKMAASKPANWRPK